MRNCPRHIHIRMLRGGTGLDEHSEYKWKWYHIINETWFMVTLLIIWLVCLILSVVA